MAHAGLAAGAVVLLLAGCADPPAPAPPPPRELTAEAVGHYCNMVVQEHPGPKGQILVEGRDAPLWFSSVRDTVAFTLLPEETKRIAAIYVNDMGRASWDRPEPGTWTDAHSAWYVVGSDRAGGMGMPELVPFAERAAAQRFAERHGGAVMTLAEIPAEAVLGGPGGPDPGAGSR